MAPADIKWTFLVVESNGVHELHVARKNAHKQIKLLQAPKQARQDRHKKPFGAVGIFY